MSRYLCSICADRAATTVVELDGWSGIARDRPACCDCLAQPAEPAYLAPVEVFASPDRRRSTAVESWHATRAAVLSVVESRRGTRTATIRRAVGATTRAQQNALTAALRRLVEAGELSARNIDPSNPRAGKLYRAMEQR